MNNISQIRNIAVIGAGTMGNGIAHVFAQHNYRVHLIDVSTSALDKGMKTINKNLERMLQKQQIDATGLQATLENIKTYTRLEEGCREVSLVVEAAREELNLKLDLFKELDKFCAPGSILATNTSSLSITQLAAATQRPGQVIGMHFMNPVPLMRLVEVIRGYETLDEVCQTVMEIARNLGKTPTEVRDSPGFVANRILMPMINEAIETLYHGVAGVKEIDTVMKLGMSHPMGPLELADFIGLDVCLAILNVLYDGFKQSRYAPCPLLVHMVQAGKLGVKAGEGFYDYSQSPKALQVAARFS